MCRVVEEFAFSCDAAGPTKVRRWLERALQVTFPGDAAHRALISDALVVATELVTNAVNAGCDNGRVSWTLEQACLRLSVFDDAPGWPVMQTPGPTDGHGRGLRIIAALAADRGTRSVEGGKAAWAALKLPRGTEAGG